jgi:hypothetical protein
MIKFAFLKKIFYFWEAKNEKRDDVYVSGSFENN